jgi:hypothetical protein
MWGPGRSFPTNAGIATSNDPRLKLNTASAEVIESDDVDQAAVGFLVKENASSHINVNTGVYLFLAIA